MKNIVEVYLEHSGETRKYYIFASIKEDNPPMFPQKIYLRKDLFAKKPKYVYITVNEKGGKK